MRKLFLRGVLSLIVLLLAALALGFALSWAPDRPVQELVKQWAPPPSTFVDVKGLKVHLRDEGVQTDPIPVVLIHGTSASLHTWEAWVDTLKSQRRVITMDLPGFGLTGPNPQNDYRNESYTQFIIDLMDTLGVQRFVLGGNSLGGDIAWQVAEKVPQRVDKLILVDAAGYPIRPQSMPIAFTIARTPVLNKMMEMTLPRSMVESSVRDVYGDPSRVTPALVDRYEALTLREGNRKALVQRFAQSNFEGSGSRIKAIKQPTLILWGGRDRLIPVENAYFFERDIAGSQLTVFDDLGHVPHEENPARTAAVVQAFLKN
ncbi:MAG: alpha/beta hydrolase [Burkholderiales bacterium RIFCSPLOWO2_02_FULL_57_36]|nr:MAG: alpha/beta hydrolase [Burkholderiales bacterium RIFCSPLOWO2_02_FULL_57_36]